MGSRSLLRERPAFAVDARSSTDAGRHLQASRASVILVQHTILSTPGPISRSLSNRLFSDACKFVAGSTCLPAACWPKLHARIYQYSLRGSWQIYSWPACERQASKDNSASNSTPVLRLHTAPTASPVWRPSQRRGPANCLPAQQRPKLIPSDVDEHLVGQI